MIDDRSAAEGEVIWRPSAECRAESGVARFTDFLRDRGIVLNDDYQSFWQWSVDELDLFWELFVEFAEVQLGGPAGPTRTPDPMPGTRWFPGRTLNYARHLLRDRDGVALVAVDESGANREIGWRELRRAVATLAGHLRSLGVREGDIVCAVLPTTEEAVVGLLASASIGAVWSVCAPEFGSGAIISRFGQLAPKVLIAAPGYRLSGKDRDRRAELALVLDALPTVEHVIWVTAHTDTPAPTTIVPATAWSALVPTDEEPSFADVDFSHPLWVLFSSGTTGIPKGIVHGHGGALIELLKMLLLHSDLRPGDRYLNVASTSWVLWNSLVSALGVGATPVLVDGNPSYPSLEHVWQIAAETRTAVLGVSAGFVHACAKADIAAPTAPDLSHLRALQVTGSPLSADGYRWVYGFAGDIWLSSMSGGTDIASIFVGGTPTLPVRVGRIQAAALGVRVESWNSDGRPAEGTGELVITEPMPSMPLYFWGDDSGDRYRSSYFDVYPGVWRHGDFIEIDEGGITIAGRSDSTLNRNGLRLGSADIYAAVESLGEIAEALVIGAEIGVDDYYMPLFVVLAEGVGAESAESAVIASIRTNLSPRYLPDEIVVMRAIPHTRTGKKLEVPIKRLLQGAILADVVDLGAVDDAELVREYAAFAAERTARRFVLHP